jgi:glutathione S-transferase
MLKLYYAPKTISIAVAITLEESGLPYEPIKIDFASAAQTKPDYLALNPKGRVPTLTTAKGTVLTETGALLEYIATSAPDAGLVPSDPETAAHMRAVMFYLASTMHVAHAHGMRGHRWADAATSHTDMAAKVPQTMAECAAYVEAECLRGDYVTGETLTLADPYLFVVSTWLEGDGVNVADYPKLTAFRARMERRDSVKAVREKWML